MSLGLGNVAGHSVTTVSTTQLQQIGHTIGPDDYGRFYEYGKFDEATIKGSPIAHKYTAGGVVFTNVFASGVKGIGVSLVSAGAAQSFGWVQVKGLGLVNLKVTVAVAARTRLYFSETGKAAVQLVTSTDTLTYIEAVAAKSGTVCVAGRYFINPW